ncbi:uncharacterized protein LOC126697400 isoform X2 [Quercus robur]|uniref:uncharacterized protein LOC126697400 isoform X2 n=1 Tax=Quercus robur TaxID=38942 RepID=UPI002163A2C6|nr:uncharacterized protein LOC126697400 isoform X2 [Quercus robur]
MAAVNKTVSLKLVVDTESQRVLYAEAGKEFVDFLIDIIALPVGAFVPLLNQEMLGGLGNIYESIENFGTTYLQPNVNKYTLLKYKAFISGSVGTLGLLQLPNVVTSTSRKLYRCKSITSCQRMWDVRDTRCPFHMCGTSEASYQGPQRLNNPYSSTEMEGGYVEEAVTYMVMDDLEVKPLSTLSMITLLDKFNLKEIGTLVEKVVNFGMDEGIKLLRASLLSKSVLTDVFLPMLKEEVNFQEDVKAE